MAPLFTNREHAGRVLAAKLAQYAHRGDAVVLALPRGGVPVAYEIAHALDIPLDFLVVRKIGVPHHPEFAMGAIASNGTYTLSRDVVDAVGITSDEFLAALGGEWAELRRREQAYRLGRPMLDLAGKTVIIVDDGLATGSSMRVAIDAVRRQHAAKVVIAVPVSPAEAQAEVAPLVDELVCVITPEPFHAVSLHYVDFTQVSDADVRSLLARASRVPAA